MSPLLAAGAAGASVAVLAHGVVGGRWVLGQLDAVALPASDLFGDGDVGRRVLLVAWHAVTAVFVVTAAALWLLAAQEREPRDLLRFVCALHVTLALVGLAVMARRPAAWLRPVPPVFALCMTTVAVTTGLAAR